LLFLQKLDTKLYMQTKSICKCTLSTEMFQIDLLPVLVALLF
jgi:hypothetical protein